jgi:hypothetical protein
VWPIFSGGQTFDLCTGHRFDRSFDRVGGLNFSQRFQHQGAGTDSGQGIDEIFAGILGGRVAEGFKHADTF